MLRKLSKKALGCALLVGVITQSGVSAQAQTAEDPPFPLLSAQLYERSLQRGVDQATNPEFLRRYDERPRDIDPFRLDWGCREPGGAATCVPRGVERDVRIKNRYGKFMHGHFSLPLDQSKAPLPAVILLSGGDGSEEPYRGIQQGLAEAGYVVLGLSVQGDARSEAAPPDPDPTTPANEHPDCQPGVWQQPQEMGISEPGSCPGEFVMPESPDQLALRVAQHNKDTSTLEEGYRRTAARKTFGALDAVRWLLSAEDPFRELIDAERVGIIGHSLGAHGALLAGNGDPERRFAAAVALDGYGLITPMTSPRIPTMFQQAEEHDYGPHLVAPVPDDRPGHKNARLFASAGVPTMLVAIAGSTHQDFLFTPPPFQQLPIMANASRDGERISLHYALAWFDRWLGRGQTRKMAPQRLLTRTYDARVDESSIGQGPYEVGGGNVPPTIAGESAQHHLSPLFRSLAYFDGVSCPDLRSLTGTCEVPAR